MNRIKMTSYQKLKQKYSKAQLEIERLQSQIDVFKNALTITRTDPHVECNDEDGSYRLCFKYSIVENRINDEIKEKLNHWVAFNLDEETVMRLLKMKKEVKLCQEFYTNGN